MSDGGKGSAPRPFSVPHSDFAANFERIFGKSEPEDVRPPNCGTSYCSCVECLFEEEPNDEPEDEDPVCTWCRGCGEGMYDGATCGKCHGSGVEPVEIEDDDYE